MNVFVTAMIGALGLLIAFRQWRTAHDKVRLDLFDRRLAIYETFVNAGSMVFYGTAKKGDEPIMDLFQAMGRAQFLFGPELIAHLQQFHDKVLLLNKLQNQWKRAETEEAQAALDDELEKANGQLEAAFEGFEVPFFPYLSLTQKDNEPWPTVGLAKARRLLGR